MAPAASRQSTRTTRRKAPVIDDSDNENITPAPEVSDDEEEGFTPAPAPLKTGRGRGRPRKSVAPEAEAPTPAKATDTTAPKKRGRPKRTTEVVEEPTQTETPPESSPQSTVPVRPAPKKRGRKPKVSVEKHNQDEVVSEYEEKEVSVTPAPEAEPSEAGDRTPRAAQTPAVEEETPQISTAVKRQRIEVRVKSEPTEDSTIQSTVEEEAVVAGPEPAAEVNVPDVTLKPSETPDAVASSQPPPPTPKVVEKINANHTVLERPMDIVAKRRAAGVPLSQEPAPPKQRTVITWLVLTNFKSYAGRQEVGPFHSSFSSVVGPNGSGKSNVIDSLLFVFGFRASKMRQGKISALIHNSAQHPDLDYCEVEVHFQEVMDTSNGAEVIPESQLVISRRAFKNNSSKYYMNKRESTFTDVTKYLKGKGVDLDHKRFLILQGEVESIAQMKPKALTEHDDGLLEYLEDIIGTSKYKTPIEESAAEVETLNETCMEKNNRVQHVEKEKGALEEKKNKALAYIRDENELATKQSTLYQLYISEFDDHIEVTQESVGQMQAQLDEELQKHQGSEEGIKELERQYKKGVKQYEQLEKRHQEFQKEVGRIDKEAVKFEEKRKFLAGKQKKLEKTKETSSYSRSEAETLAKQYTADLERYAEEMEELEANMKVEEKELERVRVTLAGKTQGLSDEIAARQKSLEPWLAKISEKQSAMAVAQSELDIIRERENAGAKGIADVEAKIEALQESKESKAAELQECKQEKKQIAKELQSVQTQIEDLASKEAPLRNKLSGARAKADEARSNFSANQTQGNVLTGLMRLKESGRIDGFHGRLGNLGTINQKYDVAISTACPQLDNMVVDTVESGQQCIEHLRKNNLGRANFILLDRLAKRDMSAVDTPENVPRLFDLVKPKHDALRPAFFHVLQNTLVADDLDQAERIAYGAKRWRVVTLDGKLIDTAGTMSGGGSRVVKGKMSSKLASDVSRDQVSRLEHDRDALEQLFTEFQQDQQELESTLRSLNQQLPELDTKAQKIALELESYDRNIADCQRRIKELGAEKAATKTDKSRVSALEKSITSMEKEIAKLHAETEGVETEIKALQDKIMEIGGVKLRLQKAKVDDLKQQIDTLTEQASNAEVSKSKEEKNRNKHEKAHNDAVRDLDKLAVDLEKVEEDMESHQRDASGVRQQAEEAQESLETTKEDLQAVKKELDEKTAEINEMRAVEIEMRNKLEESQKQLNDFQKKQAYFQDKLGKLTYQSVTDLGEEQENGEGLPTYSKDELQDLDKHELKDEIAALEKKNESTNVDLSVLAEYRKRVEEHAARSVDLAEAVTARDDAKKRCDELRRLRLEGFMEGFSIITARLKEMYQMITMGGNAELELVDSLDPFSEGILFSVMPPKKSWKNISNLSGGEKTLSSLALVFALHHYKPTPLYVMDEIDAALDFRNVSIVASYIKERTKNAQFIVISLRNNMFELASRLVGVYKVNHMTKSVTIENKDYLTASA
ncbi:Structural maintenance of chromosomes protein 4 [Didymella glomerata]|uniref:Structural maintenance of chromosomes protein n=1 Tax=Didymella glomerata TaxID=749621 RepID=A0A9W8X4K4_9PLEO|nr:Structural maintenance of chromosomes protein 4 [Didymella glomerata]